jgi:mersacidin/lichenicidin family type 2 lantibiotic
MSHLNVIRAWKDVEYRLRLSVAERAQLPDNPAGAVEMTEAELGAVAGGMPPSCNDCGTPDFNCTYMCTFGYVTCEFTGASNPC